MKRLSIALALVASLAVAAPVAAKSPPGQNSIICNDLGTGATARQSGAQGCFLDVGTGEAAAAYYRATGPFFPNGWDKPLDAIGQLSFRYVGTDPAGALRWSLQIKENGTGDPEGFAFVGADACNNGSGLVDVLNDPTCTINYGSNVYANWAEFVTAYPYATLYFAFVIADAPWTGTVSSVKIGKPGK